MRQKTTNKTYSDINALKQLASALSRHSDINITVGENEEDTKNSIGVDTSNIDTMPFEHYVGILLSKVGRARHSALSVRPKVKDKKNRPVCKEAFNILENIRVEKRMTEEYPGASYYQHIVEEHLKEETSAFLSFVDMMIPQLKDSRGGIGMENILTAEEDNNLAFTLAVAASYLGQKRELAERDKVFPSGGKIDEVKSALIDAMNDAEYARSSQEIATLVENMENTLAKVRFNEDSSKSNSDTTEDKDNNNGGNKEADIGNAIEKQLREASPALGKDSAKSYSHSSRVRAGDTNKIVTADKRARERVAPLKRKLIARMRDNDRQKYVPGKRKGTLDKKKISNVARDNFRIYQKREAKKGKKYELSIVVDTSGSMFGGEIDVALESALIMARTFRALGFPTAITLVGNDAANIYDSKKELLSAEKMKLIMQRIPNGIWHGGTTLCVGIDEGVKYFAREPGRHKLLVVITDAETGIEDRSACLSIIKREAKKGDFSPMFFYINTSISILGDPKKEVRVKHRDEILEQTIELLLKGIDI